MSKMLFKEDDNDVSLV